MNLRSNKGYTGVDISISIIILVLLVPIIGGITYNISKTGNDMNKKTNAISIAENVLELAKNIEDIKYVYSKESDSPEDDDAEKNYITSLTNNIQNRLTAPEIKNENGKESLIFSVKDEDENHYKIIIDVEDFADYTDIENPKKNLVKKVNAEVIYSVGQNTDSIEIATIISKK